MTPVFILGIDPGTTQSGFAYFDGRRVIESGVCSNETLLSVCREPATDCTVAIETIASYGMPVGREVFETCVWIGRFVEAVNQPSTKRITRVEVKSNLCHSAKANDSNIRQALIDRLGAPGTKKAQGPTYGVKTHAWAALAVAVTAYDQMTEAKACND